MNVAPTGGPATWLARPAPYYTLFFVSGAAGLIYESVWSHYLKLLLGHAALAQSLVLALFMGGMAAGAAVVSRRSVAVRNPLLAYALVEALLGLLGLAFDPIYRAVSGLYYDHLALVAGGAIAEPAKWALASLLILPQSVLLGATFPLMSAGVCRKVPGGSGAVLSWLYFSNSLGAVLGVLLSGFVLIRAVGLPGTVLTAGLLNCALAICVWALARSENSTPLVPRHAGGPSTGRLLLVASAVTGFASFFYEIGWIRMLSLVLGSSTHAFELMLAAFIFGLAAGAFAIRRRMDALSNPLRTLALIQLVMGAAAVLSLWLYMDSYDWMVAIIRSLQPNAGGYVLFNLASHLICFALMLPATFCAGMTLPLITNILIRRGGGEASIGRVYAANTVGSIAGVLLALHLAMPLLGLKAVVLIGAAADLVLGLYLLKVSAVPLWPQRALAPVAVLATLIAGLVAPWEADRLVSGVYRTGNIYGQLDEVLFHSDGRTATVSSFRFPSGQIAIATNGKVDGGLNFDRPTPDAYTTALLALFPRAVHPALREVAIVGFGTGRTSHVLLQDPQLERVDTIEIEPKMVEGARVFGTLNRLAYEDPRSRIVIADAKTFFVGRPSSYDAIISEPSNPWVSGVASLFSEEYYRVAHRSLRDDGVLVQWLQAYEIDIPLISTVVQALARVFPDYAIYASVDGDLIILAAKQALPPLNTDVVRLPQFRDTLDQLDLHLPGDLQRRLIGHSEQLTPFFASFDMPANSDFFPVLDQGAAARRFMQVTGTGLNELGKVTQRWQGEPAMPPISPPPRDLHSFQRIERALALSAYARHRSGRGERPAFDPASGVLLSGLTSGQGDCDATLAGQLVPRTLETIFREILPYMDGAALRDVHGWLTDTLCPAAREQARPWLDWLAAASGSPQQRLQGARDMHQAVFAEATTLPDWLAREWLLAALHAGGDQGLQQTLESLRGRLPESLPLRLLISYALSRR